MGATAGFARVLDEHMAATPHTPLSPSRPSTSPFPTTPDPGLRAFARPEWTWKEEWCRPAARPSRVNPLWHMPVRPQVADEVTGRLLGAAPPDPVRRLTQAERDALAILRACGATTLRDDCSRTDVQRAYRRLAKQFHPDSHPGGSAQELARLAEVFATIAGAYRTLVQSTPRAPEAAAA